MARFVVVQISPRVQGPLRTPSHTNYRSRSQGRCSTDSRSLQKPLLFGSASNPKASLPCSGSLPSSSTKQEACPRAASTWCVALRESPKRRRFTCSLTSWGPSAALRYPRPMQLQNQQGQMAGARFHFKLCGGPMVFCLSLLESTAYDHGESFPFLFYWLLAVLEASSSLWICRVLSPGSFEGLDDTVESPQS